jgi:cytochrome b pre-mRNA-processing protein 3
MLLRFLRRNPSTGTIGRLYGAIVAQARLPVFYLRGVPDTVDGRFDLIVLHLFLVTRRLEKGTPHSVGLARALFDHFCRDLDDNLREMGVSDLAVPRRMRDFASAYFGRAKAYERALAGEADLAAALARNVFSRDNADVGAQWLASYMTQQAAALDREPLEMLMQGQVRFVDPGSIGARTAGSGQSAHA